MRYTFSIYLDILPKKLQLQYLVLRLEGMAGRLRAPFLLKDWDQFPTPPWRFTSVCNSNPGHLMPFLTFKATRHIHGTYTCMQAEHLSIQKSKILSCRLRVVGFLYGVLFWGWCDPAQPGFSFASASTCWKLRVCGRDLMLFPLVLLNLVMVVVHRAMAAGLVFQKATFLITNDKSMWF